MSIYGRRRVGKTYLIREFSHNRGIYLEIMGQKDASLKEQLNNFYTSLLEAFNPILAIKKPESWKEGLTILTAILKIIPSKKKIVLFFDELPWLATKKSGILQALEYEWNRNWSKNKNLRLIVCGSAASWVIEKLIFSKGGLHNRITDTIHLKPFTLYETQEYLKSKGIQLKPIQVLELYMVMGGIPHYLKQIEKGKSSTQNINDLCFHKDGFLFSEFERLFRSLFDHSSIHYHIIREIGKKRNGILRNDLLKATGLHSGGTFNKQIKELKESGFVQEFIPFGKTKKDYKLKIVDEYTLFYLYWINPVKSKGSLLYHTNYWLNLFQHPSYQSWLGYAFESVCSKHISQILKKLRIENLALEVGSWHYTPSPKSKEKRAQIDLLINRTDNSIQIFEIKFCKSEFVIDKTYAKKLDNKLSVFEEITNCKKQLFLSMITTLGIKKNLYSEDLIQSEVTLNDLIKK